MSKQWRENEGLKKGSGTIRAAMQVCKKEGSNQLAKQLLTVEGQPKWSLTWLGQGPDSGAGNERMTLQNLERRPWRNRFATFSLSTAPVRHDIVLTFSPMLSVSCEYTTTGTRPHTPADKQRL
jgi:hypothetical protein